MVVLEWDSATEWDNAQAESGVVHEAVTNTDHNDDTVVKKGYSAANVYKATTVSAYWPLHEDSGATVYDFGGGGYNGDVVGATPNFSALLGTTGFDFDGVDDTVQCQTNGTLVDHDTNGGLTVAGWINLDQTNTELGQAQNLIRYQPAQLGSSNETVLGLRPENDQWSWTVRDDGGTIANASSSTAYGTDSWVFLVGVYDNSNSQIRLYVNGSQAASTSLSVSSLSGTGDYYLGSLADVKEYTDGQIWNTGVWNELWSDVEIQAYYDVVNSGGSLTTAKKTS